MVYTDKEKYSDILENSITYLENCGFENIKADIEGYETPKSYLKKGSNLAITPDIVATKEGRKHLFDVSLKSEKPKLLKSRPGQSFKCSLLSISSPTKFSGSSSFQLIPPSRLRDNTIALGLSRRIA